MKKKNWMILAAVLVLAVLAIVILWISADRLETVGICYRESASTENEAYRRQLEQALTDRGFRVTVTDADADQTKQLAQLRELAEKKCDVLLVEPVMTDAAQELLTVLADTGLPAVLINRSVDQALLTQYPQFTYIGPDESQPGLVQAQMVQALPDGGDLNGDGILSYTLIQGPEDHKDAQSRTEIFERSLSGAQTVQRLSLSSGDWTQDSGRKLLKQELAAYGKDIELVICGNDQMAAGAAQAIADGGRTVGKDIYLFAIGAQPDILTMIGEGTISGTAYCDPALQISAIVEAVDRKANEQPVTCWQLLPYIPVTADNAAEYKNASPD